MFQDSKTLIVSTNTCGYCFKAKSLLEHYNLKYNEVKLDEIMTHLGVTQNMDLYGDKQWEKIKK